jgi:hypothetical protein
MMKTASTPARSRAPTLATVSPACKTATSAGVVTTYRTTPRRSSICPASGLALVVTDLRSAAASIAYHCTLPPHRALAECVLSTRTATWDLVERAQRSSNGTGRKKHVTYVLLDTMTYVKPTCTFDVSSAFDEVYYVLFCFGS